MFQIQEKTDTSYKKSFIPESQLLKYLISHQHKDTFRTFHPQVEKYTFERKNIFSRIDQIWSNLSITNIEYADILTENILESDHKTIILEILIILNKPKPSKQSLRKSYL